MYVQQPGVVYAQPGYGEQVVEEVVEEVVEVVETVEHHGGGGPYGSPAGTAAQ